MEPDVASPANTRGDPCGLTWRTPQAHGQSMRALLANPAHRAQPRANMANRQAIAVSASAASRGLAKIVYNNLSEMYSPFEMSGMRRDGDTWNGRTGQRWKVWCFFGAAGAAVVFRVLFDLKGSSLMLLIHIAFTLLSFVIGVFGIRCSECGCYPRWYLARSRSIGSLFEVSQECPKCGFDGRSHTGTRPSCSDSTPL
jgi:hypothetical protein